MDYRCRWHFGQTWQQWWSAPKVIIMAQLSNKDAMQYGFSLAIIMCFLLSTFFTYIICLFCFSTTKFMKRTTRTNECSLQFPCTARPRKHTHSSRTEKKAKMHFHLLLLMLKYFSLVAWDAGKVFWKRNAKWMSRQRAFNGSKDPYCAVSSDGGVVKSF